MKIVDNVVKNTTKQPQGLYRGRIERGVVKNTTDFNMSSIDF